VNPLSKRVILKAWRPATAEASL